MRATARAWAGPGFTAIAAAIWIALALSNPTLTYHFAPPIVALVWPVTHRTLHGRAELSTAVAISAAGFLAAVGVMGLLIVADAMRGPTFWTEDGAGWEGLAFAAIASVYGLRILTRERAGLLTG